MSRGKGRGGKDWWRSKMRNRTPLAGRSGRNERKAYFLLCRGACDDWSKQSSFDTDSSGLTTLEPFSISKRGDSSSSSST